MGQSYSVDGSIHEKVALANDILQVLKGEKPDQTTSRSGFFIIFVATQEMVSS